MIVDSNDLDNQKISLKSYGITSTKINYNLPVQVLYELCQKGNLGILTDKNVLAINTGKFTGRSPKDRYIVSDTITKEKVWWGEINKPIEAKVFDNLYLKISEHLSQKELFVRDCYACASQKNRLNIRTICEYPWSDIFSHNMFIRPEINEKFAIEWTVISAPDFKANPKNDGVDNENFSIINFSKKIIIIGGTGYTGEIKKGIFSVLNFTLPVHKNILPMHCSANSGTNNDTSIFFGLSGTGKTTLSTDSSRKLIGDDEHGWDEKDNIFNFEGGCYAKVLNLSAEKEPEIYNAIKPGALLENVIIDKNGVVDFNDKSLTQNTRVSYPINFIKNIKNPSLGNNPKKHFLFNR
jgi:phosphoenolpyruvate carboxykinase (ATP)